MTNNAVGFRIICKIDEKNKKNMIQKELIKKIRRKDTQKQLAQKLSCNVKTISNIENEKTSPSLKDILRWCEIRNFKLHLIDLDVLEK